MPGSPHSPGRHCHPQQTRTAGPPSSAPSPLINSYSLFIVITVPRALCDGGLWLGLAHHRRGADGDGRQGGRRGYGQRHDLGPAPRGEGVAGGDEDGGDGRRRRRGGQCRLTLARGRDVGGQRHRVDDGLGHHPAGRGDLWRVCGAWDFSSACSAWDAWSIRRARDFCRDCRTWDACSICGAWDAWRRARSVCGTRDAWSLCSAWDTCSICGAWCSRRAWSVWRTGGGGRNLDGDGGVIAIVYAWSRDDGRLRRLRRGHRRW